MIEVGAQKLRRCGLAIFCPVNKEIEEANRERERGEGGREEEKIEREEEKKEIVTKGKKQNQES